MQDKFTIPGYAYVWVSEKETADPIAQTAFDTNNPASAPAGWIWFGSTSAENVFDLTTVDSDNIDPKYFDETPGFCDTPTLWKFTFGALFGARMTFELVLAGGHRDSTLNAWVAGDLQPTYKSVMVTFKDDDTVQSLYFRRSKLIGDPTFSANFSDFLEMPLSGYVQKPDVEKWGRFIFYEKEEIVG